MPKLDLLKGTLPLLVLSVLRDGELYGYEIAQRIRARSGELFAPSEGSLYPALHRLEKRGLLFAEWREVGGREAKFYSLTKTGRSQLDAEQDNWRRLAGAVGAILRTAE